jgi:hypothetical protein
MWMPPDKQTGPSAGPVRSAAAKQANTRIIADRQRQARQRIQAIDRRRRIATMADELSPMAVWYRQPKGAFYCTVVEGWAA